MPSQTRSPVPISLSLDRLQAHSFASPAGQGSPSGDRFAAALCAVLYQPDWRKDHSEERSIRPSVRAWRGLEKA